MGQPKIIDKHTFKKLDFSTIVTKFTVSSFQTYQAISTSVKKILLQRTKLQEYNSKNFNITEEAVKKTCLEKWDTLFTSVLE